MAKLKLQERIYIEENESSAKYIINDAIQQMAFENKGWFGHITKLSNKMYLQYIEIVKTNLESNNTDITEINVGRWINVNDTSITRVNGNLKFFS